MKHDTKYQKFVLIVIGCCAIYKLAHEINLLVCNELFVINKSTISKVLREFVVAVNFICRNPIA